MLTESTVPDIDVFGILGDVSTCLPVDGKGRFSKDKVFHSTIG